MAVWVDFSVGVHLARRSAMVWGLIMASFWLVTLSDNSSEPSPKPYLLVTGAGSSGLARTGVSSQRDWRVPVATGSNRPIGEYQERVPSHDHRD